MYGRTHGRDRSRGHGALRFLPTQLPTLAGWWRADLGVTLNGSTVSSWADQSGNGNTFSQGTAANQPTFNATGTIGNSCPTFTFDGTNDLLSAANASSLNPTGGVSFCVVAKPSADAASFYTLLIKANVADVGGDEQYEIIKNGGNDKWTVEARVAGANKPADVGTYANVSTIVTGVADGSTVTGYTNGTAGTPTAAVGALTTYTRPLELGGTSLVGFTFFAGEVAEVILYGRALGASELSRLHQYLGARYAITVA